MAETFQTEGGIMIRGRFLIWMMLGSILVLFVSAFFVRFPGYTDAEHYYSIGLQLAEGQGFNQPYVWNFLAQPSPPPQPAHLYWMPLTSVVASVPIVILGEDFRSAQIAFILIAALLPLLTWSFAERLGSSPDQQRLSASLAIFPGFFLPFLITTDAFGLFALLGSSSFLAMSKMVSDRRFISALIAGILIGLSQLTRADGLVLLLPAAWAVWKVKQKWGLLSFGLLLGYIIVLGPWMLRMFSVTGSLLPPGASKAMWLRNYDELFSYPNDFLTAQYLFSSGWIAIVLARLHALGTNLLSLLLVNHLVFLAPLVAVGAWQSRYKLLVQLAVIYLVGLLIVMSVVFPFPGSRGGFFHSSTALMPVIWSLAPIGLMISIDYFGARRAWQIAQARKVFSIGMIAIAASVTGFLAWQRLIKPIENGAGWGSGQRAYQTAGEELRGRDSSVGLVAVNNPPGFWLATGLPSVVIPDGGLDSLGAVADDFEIEWVILEGNHPAGLTDLYQKPAAFLDFEYVGSLDLDFAPSMHFFQRKGSGEA